MNRREQLYQQVIRYNSELEMRDEHEHNERSLRHYDATRYEDHRERVVEHMLNGHSLHSAVDRVHREVEREDAQRRERIAAHHLGTYPMRAPAGHHSAVPNAHYTGKKSFSTAADYVRNAPTLGRAIGRAVTVVPRTFLHDGTLIPQRAMVSVAASHHEREALHAASAQERAYHADMAHNLRGGTGFAVTRQAAMRNFGGGMTGMLSQLRYQQAMARERHGLAPGVPLRAMPAHVRHAALQDAVKNAQFEAKHHRVHGRFQSF